MILQVDQAKEQMGKHFSFEKTMKPKEIGDVEAFPWSHKDIQIKGFYWYDGQNLQVEGSISRQGEYECSRCLIKVDYKDVVAFNETFSERETWEDDGFLYYDGETIDLKEVLFETLVVNEPSQVLCKDTCKGLCPQCGIDLNVSSCDCASEKVDPRLAVLRTLLKKTKE